MKNFRKWFFLTVYLLAVALVSAYYLFPAETFKGYLAFKAAQNHPDVSLRIGEIAPRFPPGLRLQAISVAYNGSELAAVDALDVTPDYLALLGLHPRLHFDGRAYAGRLTGDVALTTADGASAMTVAARLAGLQTAEMALIERLSGRKVHGTLAGTLELRREGTTAPQGTAVLTLSNGKVDLLTPLFDLDSIAFKTVDAELTLDPGRLRINRCDVRGPQLDAAFSGAVTFKAPVGESGLNVNGTVSPHAVLMARLRKSLPGNLLSTAGAGGKRFPVNFTGTLEAPEFTLK